MPQPRAFISSRTLLQLRPIRDLPIPARRQMRIAHARSELIISQRRCGAPASSPRPISGACSGAVQAVLTTFSPCTTLRALISDEK
jgi:hypothetical protein